MISQLGPGNGQKTNTLANPDPDLFLHMAPIDQNELNDCSP